MLELIKLVEEGRKVRNKDGISRSPFNQFNKIHIKIRFNRNEILSSIPLILNLMDTEMYDKQ